MSNVGYTLFIDIDGTLLRHFGGPLYQIFDNESEVLDGVREKISQWHLEGHYIILTTARTECMRKMTEEQLQKHGIIYHQLVMGIGHNKRFVINDDKPSMDKTALGITVKRNVGIKDINLEDY